MRAYLLALCLTGAWFATAAADVETGTIAGAFADTQRQNIYVGNAVVFLCDAESGYPLDRHTKKPFDFSRTAEIADRCWYTVVEDKGSFQFADVPAGHYRVFAQSWSGTKGLPALQGKTSPFVHLHGCAEIEVKAGEQAVAWIEQLGDGVLEVSTDPESHGDAYLVLSLEPTTGDPILGLSGWGPGFTQNVVGFTHLSQPRVTIYGLPDKRPIHAAVFVNDNLPGVGAATFAVWTKRGTIPIIAAWSNGHHDPPPRLRELTAHVAREGFSIEDLIEKGGKSVLSQDERQSAIRALYNSVAANPERLVEVPGLGPQPLSDVLAAISYAQLQKSWRK